MHSFFSPFPYIRLLIYWVIGILLARFCPLWAWAPIASLGVAILFLQRDFLLALIFITLSIFRFEQVQISSSLFADLSKRACVIQIIGQPIEKANSWSAVGRALALRDQGTWKSGSGYWKVYFEKSAFTPKQGEKYLVMGYLNPIAPSLLPGGMDWPRYYAQKGVGGQIYAKKGAWVLLDPQDDPWAWLARVQKYFQTKIRSAMPAGVNRDVAEAMFLGVSSSIDFETMQGYASLGAIHILSVSGLHVGFLYLGLAFIFGFFRRWPWVHFLLIIFFLWAYAGMTGFSGPVLRSAWMFTVVLAARSFRLKHHPVNTLAFSCLILLVWDPQFLFQAGFQLSYAAVLGLILFQDRLKKCYVSRFWLIDHVWEVTCVAIAAQALTWPLVIYYFHQFPHPFYFFLLNPLLILVSSITLGVGFVFLALSPFAFSWLGYALNYCFQCFHGILFFVADNFHPTLAMLALNERELIAYYIMISLAAAWWRYRMHIFLYGIASLLVFVFVQRWVRVPQKGLYLTAHEGHAVVVQLANAHAALYGNMNPAWIQSNVIPLLTHEHIRDTVSRRLPVAWRYANHFVYVARRPCVPSTHMITDLIIEPNQTTRDLRWLKSWPHAHWYFVRRPSAYRLGQLRGFPAKGITFLDEVPAVYFKKKAAFGRQPELD